MYQSRKRMRYTHRIPIDNCLYGLLMLLVLLTGCTSYSMTEVYTALETGQPEVAFTYMEEMAPKNQKLPFLFEQGVVAHYANRFPESNKVLSIAEDISEDLYTRSVSKEGLALLTNDLVRPYPGTRFERLLSHYYRILNYVYLNQLDGALVECRRAANLMNAYKAENENYDFFAAGFLAYLSAICFEATSDWNDAFISYRQAETYYQHASEKTGLKMPRDVGHSLVRMARKLGFTQEADDYQRRYGEPLTRPPGTGELVLFYENGYIPGRYEKTLTFPILKTDTKLEAFEERNQNNERTAEDFAEILLKRRSDGRSYKDVDIEYILHVAMPAISSRRPDIAGIELQTETGQQSGVLVADLETIAIETFNAQASTILARTMTRTVLKYFAYRIAKTIAEAKAKEAEEKREQREKEKEKLTEEEKEQLIAEENAARIAELLADFAGDVVNIVNMATESADTRCWRLLPNRIFLIRTHLPSGTHNLTLSFLDADGENKASQTLRDVEILPNRITFLNYRTYE